MENQIMSAHSIQRILLAVTLVTGIASAATSAAEARDKAGTTRPAPVKADSVRDHRAAVVSPDVRDHRAPVVTPVVRDHRSTGGVTVRKVGRGAAGTLRGSEDKVQSTGTKFVKFCGRTRCHNH
jgi:hypothetical protein